MRSPAKTGFVQRRFLKPGEGPRRAGRSGATASWRLRCWTMQAIQTAAVCQPEAASLPNELLRAAASSMWKGCGSKLRAKATISSDVKTKLPSSWLSPTESSSKKRGGPGTVLDVPLGHKDAAYVRSHFDGVEIRIADAPRAREIVVAVAVTDGGRPLLLGLRQGGYFLSDRLIEAVLAQLGE